MRPKLDVNGIPVTVARLQRIAREFTGDGMVDLAVIDREELFARARKHCEETEILCPDDPDPATTPDQVDVICARYLIEQIDISNNSIFKKLNEVIGTSHAIEVLYDQILASMARIYPQLVAAAARLLYRGDVNLNIGSLQTCRLKA